MAFTSIKERRLRSSLTVLGIVIGIAAIVSLVSIGEGMRLMISEQLEGFGANKILVIPSMRGGMAMGEGMGGKESLEEKDLDEIKKIRGIDIVAPMLAKSLPIEYDDETTVMTVTGIDPDEIENILADVQGINLEKGRYIRESDRYSTIIGHRAAYDLFSEDIRLRDKLKIKGTTFGIVGILKETGTTELDMFVVMPLETLRDITDSKDEISMIIASAEDVNKIDKVAEDIQDKLDKMHGEDAFEAITTTQLAERIGSITSIITIFLGGISAISLLVAGVGIANTMLMSVIERTREIGIMKAIGATNVNIQEIFLMESALLGLVGGIIGCIFGIGISNAISRVSIFSGVQMRTAVTSELLLIGLGFSVGVGVISGLWPARRAAKLKPVEALHYE